MRTEDAQPVPSTTLGAVRRTFGIAQLAVIFLGILGGAFVGLVTALLMGWIPLGC